MKPWRTKPASKPSCHCLKVRPHFSTAIHTLSWIMNCLTNPAAKQPERPLFRNGGVGNVHEPGDGLRTRANVQFLVDAADMRVDCRHADVQQVGDFLVEVPASEQLQNFPLAVTSTRKSPTC